MIIDEFYKAIQKYPSFHSVFTIYDILVNFLLPCLLVTMIAYVYKRTHKGVTYNQSFVHTMFIMSVTTSIIMMIIGSNIARAFSLVGALSIIRFRTAVKDSKDIGYIFLSIAVGMACGTGMYLVACLFSVLSSALLFALNFAKVGEKVFTDKLLKVQLSQENISSGSLEKLILKNAKNFSLVHSENITEAGDQLFTYIFSSEGGKSDQSLLNEIRELNGGKQASIYYNDQRIEL